MLIEHTPSDVRTTLAVRSGTSRKLLARKAQELAPVLDGTSLEDSFPASAVCPDNAKPNAALACSSSGAAVAPNQPLAAAVLWSSEDETGFQTLSARRKAAGYQRRGKDVSAQVLFPGQIRPNADTVVATIVGIVAERGNVARAELINLMGSTTFPHAKARPADKAWCQGYVAGAVRNGFLTVEPSPTVEGA